jgi:hypothetical protein
MLTPHRHLRLDPTVPPGVLGLDKVVPDILMGHARSESRKILPRFEQIFAGHAALPFRPLYSTSSGGHDAAVG